MSPEVFLDLHCQQVPVKHGRGFHEGFAQRHAGNLERETASRPDASLHILGSFPEVDVAGIEFRPCGKHAYSGPAFVIRAAEPRLGNAFPVNEASFAWSGEGRASTIQHRLAQCAEDTVGVIWGGEADGGARTRVGLARLVVVSE